MKNAVYIIITAYIASAAYGNSQKHSCHKRSPFPGKLI